MHNESTYREYMKCVSVYAGVIWLSFQGRETNNGHQLYGMHFKLIAI